METVPGALLSGKAAMRRNVAVLRPASPPPPLVWRFSGHWPGWLIALPRPGSWKTASVTNQKPSLFTLPQIILWETSPNTGHPMGECGGGELCLVLRRLSPSKC